MEEAAELFKKFLLTPDSFRKLRNSPEQPPVKPHAISEVSNSEVPNSEVSNSELTYSESVTPNVGRVSIPGQDAFMAPASFWPEVDFRSIRSWDNQSGTETIVAEGGVRSGSTMVTEPGMGSPQSHHHQAYQRDGRSQIR